MRADYPLDPDVHPTLPSPEGFRSPSTRGPGRVYLFSRVTWDPTPSLPSVLRTPTWDTEVGDDRVRSTLEGGRGSLFQNSDRPPDLHGPRELTLHWETDDRTTHDQMKTQTFPQFRYPFHGDLRTSPLPPSRDPRPTDTVRVGTVALHWSVSDRDSFPLHDFRFVVRGGTFRSRVVGNEDTPLRGRP